jgi:type III secretion protein V
VYHARVSRSAGRELALIVAVIALAVGLILIPLPGPALDLLLVAGIGAGAVVLVAAAGAPRPLAVPGLPALLLLAVLFRLVVGVAVVRAILQRGEAGAVAVALGGAFGGGVAVGITVLGLLALAQYLVVARGAERSAEVAARFALDALPGKQMGVDADLRAGALSPGEAAARRAGLEREARFLGAMDGALRFVKGDAIAGALLVVAALVGGALIGSLGHGLSAREAIAAYGRLAVGYGLAAQLPALCLTSAAALLLARAGEPAGSGLGRELGDLLGGSPAALAVGAVVLLALAVVPGFPALPFVAVGAGLGLGALALLRAARRAPSLSTSPLVVEAPAPIAGLAGELAAGMRARLGVSLPLVVTPAPAWRLRLSGHTVSEGSRAAVEAGLDRIAAERVGVHETRLLLDEIERDRPALVREVVPRLVSLPVLAGVLRRLLAEGVPVGDLGGILDALAARPAPGKDADELAEDARAGLARALTARALAGAARLRVLVLDPLVEDTLREALRPGAVLALEPGLAADLTAAAGRAVAAGPAVVLVDPILRRPLRRLLAPGLPGLAVLSHREVLPETPVEIAGTIRPT